MLRVYLAIAGAISIGAGCYIAGRASLSDEITALHAVANATDARYRQLETEVANAQQAYVTSWTASRDAARNDWLRLKADSDRRVPLVCAESGSTQADQRDGVEASGGEGDRDLLPALVRALETGEELEATLTLCQAELRQCADMR